MLTNKEIVLGITGSIAAYKACEIASRLTECGARVIPVLTYSAQQLVGVATFEAICKHRAITQMFGVMEHPEIEHITIAKRADLFLIAPATANIIAKAAHGLADDWLSTTLLATRAPIVFAPAMNTAMYTHPATMANIATLKSRGCVFVGPDSGRLACGEEGPGRMIAPMTIIEAILPLLSKQNDLKGKRVLITSGSTQEPIDPARIITNRSSGKMGRAIALEALVRGAETIVVAGPAETPLPYGVEIVPVKTGQQMADAVMSRIHEADIVIGAAAVADYHVANAAGQKLKKTGRPVSLVLEENPDILSQVIASKRKGQIIVGFAAETENIVDNAKKKLATKKLDMIVANAIHTTDSGFGTDTIKAAIITADGTVEELPLMSKEDLATTLFDRISSLSASGKGKASKKND